jgi:RNA polymerase sigma-70 factor (ECF subfamily)
MAGDERNKPSEPGERNDEELMLAHARGDANAFGRLFTRFAPQLLRIARRQVSREADAQDIVQQTFLQAHRARHDFKAHMRLRPWLVTIALNLGRDLLRRRGRRPETDIDTVPLADPAVREPGSDGEEAERSGRVRAALAMLPADQREVIELHWFEELSFGDIAEAVGATAGAVRVRAHRGYVALRKQLGDLAGPGSRIPDADVR